MAVDKTALFIPGHGTAFTAPPNTKPPATPLDVFKLTADGPTPWVNMGHTSKANTISFTKEGGEKETLDTFLQDGVRTTTSATRWGVNIPALQVDQQTLDLAFNGDFDPATGGYTIASAAPLEVALFLFFQDTTGHMGFWIPSTEIALGDPMQVDTANFFELPLSGSILSVADDIIPAVDGRAGIFQLFKTGLTAP